MTAFNLLPNIPRPGMRVERHLTRGMTAIAVVNVVFGSLGIFNGLFQLLGAFLFTYELLRLGAGFEIPVGRLSFSLFALATALVGLIAGGAIFRLRPWARILSLVYGGLLILLLVFAYFTVPIISSIGTYDPSSIDAYGAVRLIIFSVLYIVFPVPYAVLLWFVFHKRAWKATFAQ